MRIKPFLYAGNAYLNGFTLYGSNVASPNYSTDDDWTSIYSGNHANNSNWEDYEFENAIAYRHYKLKITSSYRAGSGEGGFYEIELMESYKGAYYWVKVPNVYNSVDTTIFMYYGKSDASDGADPTNVWDSYHKGVWHLKESGSGVAGEYKDSTVNANNGQGSSAPTCVDGKIYKCQQFASNKKINIPQSHGKILRILVRF